MSQASLFSKPLCLIALFAGLAHAESAPTAGKTEVPKFKKVVVVLFENEDIDKPLSRPFFSRLAKDGALLTNYHAVSHPSEPNYIALTSGDLNGVSDDRNYDLDVRHLGDLLEEKGKTWKNYAEGFPGGCFKGMKKGRYVRKHTPFMSYVNVQNSPARCKNIVNADQFGNDLAKGILPDFSFFTPDMDNDGHDTDIQTSDAWFAKTFGPLLNDSRFKDVLLVATFDENACNTVGPHIRKEKLQKCQGDSNIVFTAFYGAGVKRGVTSTTNYNHYSLLKTIEAGFDLGSLGKNDATASTITGIWE